MSWDISIQDLPADAKKVADISIDFQPIPLGPRSEVIARLQQILPEIDFRDPSWGLLDGGNYSIEFNMGREEICSGFMLHVRGGGDAVMTVARVLQHLKLRGLDCQTGDFFTTTVSADSFGQWQAFRDRVMSGYQKNPDES